MKKLVLLSVLSAFGFTAAAAHACDGMKGHDKSADTKTQAKKEKKTDEAAAETEKDHRIRQLERTLGRKSLEIEILKNVVGE